MNNISLGNDCVVLGNVIPSSKCVENCCVVLGMAFPRATCVGNSCVDYKMIFPKAKCVGNSCVDYKMVFPQGKCVGNGCVALGNGLVVECLRCICCSWIIFFEELQYHLKIYSFQQQSNYVKCLIFL